MLPLESINPAAEAKWDIEPIATVQKRALAFWDELFPADGSFTIERQGDINVLISTHGAFIRHFLDALHGRGYAFPPTYKSDARPGNCAIVTIEMQYVEGKWDGAVTDLGSSEHLGEKATFAVDEQAVVAESRIA